MTLDKAKCNACNGVFFTAQADGEAYYHACAPVLDKVTGLPKAIANAVDQNVASTSGPDAGQPKAVGAGVTPQGALVI